MVVMAGALAATPRTVLTIILINSHDDQVEWSSVRGIVRVPSLTVAAVAAVLVSACGAGTSGAGHASGDPLDIQASFYPLQWIAEQVGGDAVTVSSLTPPGAEPHDLELSPQDVAAISDADLVVYLSDFQAAVDAAVLQEAADSSFDAADHTALDLTYTPIEEGQEATDETGSVDPHFWLDPIRLADVADALAQRLRELDADSADKFTANAAQVRSSLEDLDAELTQGLASCENSDLVTSHNAFGYFAAAYGLTQVGVTGLTPEEEPSASSLAEVASFVEEHDVRTIYFETLIGPEIAETVADEAGVDTAVLDPIEGLNDTSAGSDYLEVMRSNLASLRAGQPCS